MVEYSYPDFMPKEGELILVRDLLTQGWRSRTFCEYQTGKNYPWYTQTEEGVKVGWRYARPCSATAVATPVLYTKENPPISGQPILVSDDAKEWNPRLYAFHNARAEFPWCAGDRNWKYAAHYDEQFWLAQQEKKKEPVGASKQAEKLAIVLAECCHGDDCPTGRKPRPINVFCCKVTKKDWLAWAAKKED